jgi:hypothetical protein
MVNAATIALMLLGLSGCVRNPCANASMAESLSPDRQLKVVTFRRDCGGATKESVQISILAAEEKLANEAGNVFVAAGTPTLVTRWIDSRHLTISGGAAATAPKAEKSFLDVEITYE